MTAPPADVEARLREKAKHFDGWDGNADMAALLREAATALERIARERDEARERASTFYADVEAYSNRAEAADARIVELTRERDEARKAALEEAIAAIRDMWQATPNVRTDSALTSFQQNEIGPGCAAAMEAVRAILNKGKPP